MSVAKVIEIKAASRVGIEDAIQSGLAKCAETVRDIQGASIEAVRVVTDPAGAVAEWRVDLKVTFLVR